MPNQWEFIGENDGQLIIGMPCSQTNHDKLTKRLDRNSGTKHTPKLGSGQLYHIYLFDQLQWGIMYQIRHVTCLQHIQSEISGCKHPNHPIFQPSNLISLSWESRYYGSHYTLHVYACLPLRKKNGWSNMI